MPVTAPVTWLAVSSRASATGDALAAGDGDVPGLLQRGPVGVELVEVVAGGVVEPEAERAGGEPAHVVPAGGVRLDRPTGATG